MTDSSTTQDPQAVASTLVNPDRLGRLNRSQVVAIYLLGSAALLLLGIGLNYLLTGGRWYVPTGSANTDGYFQNDTFDIVSGFVLVFSLTLLGYGFLSRNRQRHLVRALGFVVFGFYWGLRAMGLYAAEEGDFVNAAFAMLAVFFFNYFAYHEVASYYRNEDPRALHWLTGTAFITTGVYFLTHKIQPIAHWLILRVSEQTQWLLVNVFHQGVVRCGGVPEGSMIYYPSDAELGCLSGAFFPIQIILACTAIQSIMIFVGGILALRPPRMGEGVSGKALSFERLRGTYPRRRLWGFLLTVPLIYVLNLFRNVIIIWMSAQEDAPFFSTGGSVTGWLCAHATDCGPVVADWDNQAAFWFSHNVIGKGGSLLALVLIAFIVFQILPELYDSIIGLLDLKERRGPLETWFGKQFGRRGNGGAREPSAPAVHPAKPPPSPEPRAE